MIQQYSRLKYQGIGQIWSQIQDIRWREEGGRERGGTGKKIKKKHKKHLENRQDNFPKKNRKTWKNETGNEDE